MNPDVKLVAPVDTQVLTVRHTLYASVLEGTALRIGCLVGVV